MEIISRRYRNHDNGDDTLILYEFVVVGMIFQRYRIYHDNQADTLVLSKNFDNRDDTPALSKNCDNEDDVP